MAKIDLKRTADLARSLGAFVNAGSPDYLTIAEGASEIPGYIEGVPMFNLEGAVLRLRRARRDWTMTLTRGGPPLSEVRVTTQAEVDAAVRKAYGAETDAHLDEEDGQLFEHAPRRSRSQRRAG